MYCILYDTKTGGIYMPPGNMVFYAYKDPSRCLDKPLNTRLIETEYDTEQEIKTIMWKAGFLRGYIDDSPVNIASSDVLCFGRNANDVIYCQYILTHKKEYLDGLNSKNLYTLCKIEGNDVLFPAVKEKEHYAILAYTSPDRMSKALFDKYQGYRMIRISFFAPFIINENISIGM